MHYSEINPTVIEYLNETFKAPFLVKTDKYEIGTVLYTANPYIRTNATIVDIVKTIGIFYVVLTDIGNIIHLNEVTLKEEYLPPQAKRHSGPPPEDMNDYFTIPNTGTIMLYP